MPIAFPLQNSFYLYEYAFLLSCKTLLYARMKMPFSHSLMKRFLEGFLICNTLSQSLIILSEHFCRKF